MKTIILALIFILTASFAQAEVLKFQWTANPPGTEGYNLYMDTGDVPILVLPGHETVTAQITVDLEGVCHNFWLRAYGDGMESDNSDIAEGCPVSSDPPAPVTLVVPGGFTLIVIPN